MAVLTRLGKYKDYGLLILRVGLGVMFIYHGFPKLMGGPDKWERLGTAMNALGIHFVPMLWGFLSAVIETVGGFLVITGLLFRPVCILLVANLAVAAIFTYRISGSLADATHAIEDAITFTGLIFIGPGRYSIDKNNLEAV